MQAEPLITPILLWFVSVVLLLVTGLTIRTAIRTRSIIAVRCASFLVTVVSLLFLGYLGMSALVIGHYEPEASSLLGWVGMGILIVIAGYGALCCFLGRIVGWGEPPGYGKGDA